MKIQYFAAALTNKGKVGQLLVTRENGQHKQEWTGKVYRTHKESMADLAQLNRNLAR